VFTESQHSLRRARYSLALAMIIVRQIETSEGRRAVFAEIKEKNAIIRLVDRIYTASGPKLMRRLLLCLYMLKCVASLNSKPATSARAVAVANFANEAHAIDRVTTLVPEIDVAKLRPDLRNLFTRGQFRAIAKFIAVLPRSWRLLGKIARAYSFMPACRISSTLAYYTRFGDLLDANPALVSAIVASNYSPEAVGLSAAAHRREIPVIYINHAPVPRNSPYVPPVLADCSVFHGNAVQETYELRSRCVTHAVLVGLPGDASPMEWRDKIHSIGVFLTALTRTDTVERLVAQIKDAHPDARLLIRHHPVALLETDLSRLCARYPDINVTLGTPLADDIASCDAVVCGNSGVVLNTLHGGRPVAYLPELDDLPLDYNGFFESGLVLRVHGWSDETYASLKSFYQMPNWPSIMRKHDASYGCSLKDLESAARESLLSYLGA
jgi:hypothetical protein